MDQYTNKNIVLFVTTLSSFLTPFMASSINIALPSIGHEFSLNAVLLSWIPTSYILAAAMFLVPFGRVADIYGRKRIFLWGILIYTIASLISAISYSVIALIASRVLQGIGSAMVFGTGVAILTSVYPVEERGKALGINVAGVYLGLSLGPFLGGFLTQQFGWRSIFWINVPLGIIIIGLIFWQFRSEWAEAQGEKFDLIGSLIYVPMLIAIMYGFSLLPTIIGFAIVGAGIIAAVAFVYWELKTTHPILDINLFKNNTVFTFSNLAALINYSATSAVGFLLSLYLQYIKGFDPQHAGFILISQPLMQAIFSPFAGRLSDKIEPQIVASIGMALTVLGLASLIFLTSQTGLTVIIATLVILGVGFALFSSPNTNAIMSSVEKKLYGIASGTLGTMRLSGQMLSMGIVMITFALNIGHVQILPQYYPLFLKSMQTAFIIFALCCFCGIFASLARGRLR